MLAFSHVSLLQPGARIVPHHGLTNVRLICHLPLIVPRNCGALRVGNETRPWREGRLTIFDDTIEHDAWNSSNALRAVLLFDVWRPELSKQERALVSTMLTAVSRFGNTGRRRPEFGLSRRDISRASYASFSPTIEIRAGQIPEFAFTCFLKQKSVKCIRAGWLSLHGDLAKIAALDLRNSAWAARPMPALQRRRGSPTEPSFLGKASEAQWIRICRSRSKTQSSTPPGLIARSPKRGDSREKTEAPCLLRPS
jgi:hypothetical protein